VNIPAEDLDQWARKLQQANSALLRAQDALRRMQQRGQYPQGDAETALILAEQARTALLPVAHGLERAGAVVETRDDLPPPSGCVDPANVPLEYLTSPANRRFAEALRTAYEACCEVSKERGWLGDGPEEMLEDWLAGVEQEVYGPAGLGER